MSINKMVAVSTFCSWASYGSLLQAYALKQTLQKVGCSSYILIDRPVVTPQAKCRIPVTLNPITLLRSCINRYFLPAMSRQYLKNNKFIRENIDIIYYSGYEELMLNYLPADYYLSGSDQVFNPNNPQPGFYFDYIPDKSKLLTYACSTGTTCVPLHMEGVFADRLKNFNRISVREASCISMLKKYHPDAIYQTNIDPTFLLSADEWRQKEKPYHIEGDYILLYPLYWNNSLNKEIKKLKKISGMKVICVCTSGLNSVICDNKFYDVGVEEFLWLVDHAQAVITSSFHGAAFAVIFEKKLALVINPDLPSRMNHIANLLGLPKCEIANVLSVHIDYEKVKKKVEEERKRSFLYLEEILNGQ